MTKRAGKKKNKSPPPNGTTADTNGKPVSHSGSLSTAGTATGTATDAQSLYWPALSPSARKLAQERGQLETIDKIANIRLDMIAVKKRYPIPEDVKAFQVYQAYSVIANAAADTKDKIAASRLLAAMEQMNQRDETGPDQIGIQVTLSTGETVLASDYLDELRKTWDYSIDERPIKAIPGSPEDYAE